jgi:hypothetical protein
MDIAMIPGLAPFADRLSPIGYAGSQSFERLANAARVAPKHVAKYLDISESNLADLINTNIAFASVMSAAEASELETLPCALGANLEGPSVLTDKMVLRNSIVATAIVSSATAAALPPSVNLQPHPQPIRDQGPRGTCVAHACVAVYEHKASALGDLSEQYLYWDCKQNDGIPLNEGTWARIAMQLIQRDGVCSEAVWPYNPNIAPGNISQGPPPNNAIAAALLNCAATIQIAANGVADYKTALNSGHCVAFSIPVFDSWYLPALNRKNGMITLPIPGEIANGGHAMCILGYEDNAAPEYPGGGYFILRNSWSTSWGSASAYGPGYGTIPYAYIAKYGAEAWIMA